MNIKRFLFSSSSFTTLPRPCLQAYFYFHINWKSIFYSLILKDLNSPQNLVASNSIFNLALLITMEESSKWKFPSSANSCMNTLYTQTYLKYNDFTCHKSTSNFGCVVMGKSFGPLLWRSCLKCTSIILMALLPLLPKVKTINIGLVKYIIQILSIYYLQVYRTGTITHSLSFNYWHLLF